VRLLEHHPIEVTLDRDAPLGFCIRAGGEELAQSQLESPQVTAVVSTIAAHPRVRDAMVAAQRRIADGGSVVMAGRDIGSVVLPQASCKIYLTASAGARIARRRAQLEAAGLDVKAHDLATEIRERDRLDESRAISPLRVAAGAHIIDSSPLSAEDVVARIARIVQAAGTIRLQRGAYAVTVAIYRATGSRNGIDLDVDQALVIRIRDGRWQDVTAVPHDPQFERFWASELRKVEIGTECAGAVMCTPSFQCFIVWRLLPGWPGTVDVSSIGSGFPCAGT